MGRYGGWPSYVPVGERIARAKKEIERRRKAGKPISPVIIEGRIIAKSFWGRAWCDNLESYSDYANRLPRGSSYVRNGSVIDLQISPGKVTATVCGSSLYTVTISINPVNQAQWQSICRDCAGSIDSLVDLLQGRLSKGVMERVCQRKTGLFPQPSEIDLSCSCPDWASMCKHVAASLYGVGARLDQQPELLFRLRGVDETELLASADSPTTLTKKKTQSDRILAGEDLADIFGLEIDSYPPEGSRKVLAEGGRSRQKSAATKKSASVKKSAAVKKSASV
ncbi:MAG: hypothetical protein ACOYLF_00270, partial [Blastocatellia bacterium]